MAGLADGSTSLSMSGREELMALKQASCLASLSLSLFVSLCLSLTHNTYFIFFICRS